jgi:hypothetical protein
MVTTFRGDILFTPNGGNGGRKPPDPSEPSLELKVTLTDGRIITLSATDLVIDYGDNGKLHVKPNGLVDPIGKGKDPRSPTGKKQ